MTKTHLRRFVRGLRGIIATLPPFHLATFRKYYRRSFMVSKIRTVAFRGIDVLDIDVEVQITGGLLAISIVENIK